MQPTKDESLGSMAPRSRGSATVGRHGRQRLPPAAGRGRASRSVEPGARHAAAVVGTRRTAVDEVDLVLAEAVVLRVDSTDDPTCRLLGNALKGALFPQKVWSARCLNRPMVTRAHAPRAPLLPPCGARPSKFQRSSSAATGIHSCHGPASGRSGRPERRELARTFRWEAGRGEEEDT
jgi:hypothetical protein